MLSKTKLFIAAAIASGLSASPAASAPRYSEFGHVVGLETGWLDDTMGVKLDVPFVNSFEMSWLVFSPLESLPHGRRKPCKITTAGYALDPKDRGVKLHQAVLLSAFLAGRKVRVLVEGCIYDKPRIIGVGIGVPIY